MTAIHPRSVRPIRVIAINKDVRVLPLGDAHPEVERLDRAVHTMVDPIQPPWLGYLGALLWTIAVAIVSAMAGAALVQP